MNSFKRATNVWRLEKELGENETISILVVIVVSRSTTLRATSFVGILSSLNAVVIDVL